MASSSEVIALKRVARQNPLDRLDRLLSTGPLACNRQAGGSRLSPGVRPLRNVAVRVDFMQKPREKPTKPSPPKGPFWWRCGGDGSELQTRCSPWKGFQGRSPCVVHWMASSPEVPLPVPFPTCGGRGGRGALQSAIQWTARWPTVHRIRQTKISRPLPHGPRGFPQLGLPFTNRAVL
jgi:hypothetical protein